MTTSADPLRRLAPVVRLAPAKLNLTLAVVERRPDGFHTLHTIMVPLALADRLSLTPGYRGRGAAPGVPDSLAVEGFDPGPVSDNLVLRAVAAARAAVGPHRAPPLAIRLEKRIPVAAGLAGGSSDAAAALDGALEAWGAELDPHAWYRVASELGSDVPFFVGGRTALVEGRGDQLTTLEGIRGEPPGVLLVTPPIACSTKEVFGAFDGGARPELIGSAIRASEHLAAELGSGMTADRLVERAAIMAAANDLLPAAAAVLPGLVPFRRALFRTLRRPIGLSGSGATLWALYPSLSEAAAAAEIVRGAVTDGDLPLPGGEPPFITATTLQPGGHRA